MPSPNQGLYIRAAGRLAERVPGLRMVPIVRLLLAAEILLVGKHHLDQLTPQERGRMIRLVSQAKGRPRNLSEAEQLELTALVQKLEPRLFLAEATDRISPVGVPSPLRKRLAGPKR